LQQRFGQKIGSQVLRDTIRFKEHRRILVKKKKLRQDF
jgi:hypothetical protein